MGGRGTFASGNPVPYSYETVGKIEGVKVLQKIDKKQVKDCLKKQTQVQHNLYTGNQINTIALVVSHNIF